MILINVSILANIYFCSDDFNLFLIQTFAYSPEIICGTVIILFVNFVDLFFLSSFE